MFRLSTVYGLLRDCIVEGESTLNGELVIVAMLRCERNDPAKFSYTFNANLVAVYTGESR